jgi:hypothetical protein
VQGARLVAVCVCCGEQNNYIMWLPFLKLMASSSSDAKQLHLEEIFDNILLTDGDKMWPVLSFNFVSEMC